jgi:hypothetical protein
MRSHQARRFNPIKHRRRHELASKTRQGVRPSGTASSLSPITSSRRCCALACVARRPESRLILQPAKEERPPFWTTEGRPRRGRAPAREPVRSEVSPSGAAGRRTSIEHDGNRQCDHRHDDQGGRSPCARASGDLIETHSCARWGPNAQARLRRDSVADLCQTKFPSSLKQSSRHRRRDLRRGAAGICVRLLA